MKRAVIFLILKVLIPIIIIAILIWFVLWAGSTIGGMIGGTIEKHVEYNPTTVKKVESIISKWKEAFDPVIKTWECINDPEKCYIQPWEEVQSVEHKEQIEKRYGIEIIPPLSNPEGVFYCDKRVVVKYVEEDGEKKKIIENATCEGSEVPIYFNIKVNLPFGEKADLKFGCSIDYSCNILNIKEVTPSSIEAIGNYEGQAVCILNFNPEFYKDEECLYHGKIKKYYEVPVIFKTYYAASTKTDFWILIVKPEAYSPDFFERYKLSRMRYTVSRWIGVPGVTIALGSPNGREAVYLKMESIPIYLAAVLKKEKGVTVEDVNWEICLPKVFNLVNITLPEKFIDRTKIKTVDKNNYKCIDFTNAITLRGLDFLNEKGYLPLLLKLNYTGDFQQDYAEYYIYATVNYVALKKYTVYVKYYGMFPTS